MTKAKKVDIYYDSREHTPVLMKIKQAGYKPTKKLLPVGDYHIIGDNGQEVFIELKLGKDFYQSVFEKKKRLSAQLADLSEKDFALVVFVGENIFDDKYIQFVPDRFASHYPTSNVNLIASNYRKQENGNMVGFLQLPSMREFQDLIIYYANKIKKGELYKTDITGEAIRILADDTLPNDWDEIKARQVGMLMKIGNVGFDKAVLLHKAFDGDIAKVFSASDKELTDIKGIGKKVVQGFRELGIVDMYQIRKGHTEDYLDEEMIKAGMETMYGTSETDKELEAKEPKKNRRFETTILVDRF